MVGRVAASCAGHVSSGVDGSPVCTKASQASIIRSARASASGPAPVKAASSPRPWLPNTKAISRPWQAPSQPRMAGEPQPNRYTNVGAWSAWVSATRSAGTRNVRSVSTA